MSFWKVRVEAQPCERVHQLAGLSTLCGTWHLTGAMLTSLFSVYVLIKISSSSNKGFKVIIL